VHKKLTKVVQSQFNQTTTSEAHSGKD